jgi:CobQ-like glutamine amidotransferase family enzyme
VITIAKLLPDISNGHADAENAHAIAMNLHWLGYSARIDDVRFDQELPASDVFVLGDVAASDFEVSQAAMASWGSVLKHRLREGAIFLAIGSGISLAADIGLLRGTVTSLPKRVIGDVIVQTSEGLLWGFENNDSGYLLADGEMSLGTVTHGIGNGGGTEGVRSQMDAGLVLGTHLHGPVLVRNEELMDEVIARLIGSFDESNFSDKGILARKLARENRSDHIKRVSAG